MPRRNEDGDVIDRPNRRARVKKEEEESSPTPALTAPTPSKYGYSTDLGKYGANDYTYQEGDEMTNPGPEPPRDSPEWPAWKAHAKAWRRHIGQRQAWVDMMLSLGSNLEDLGIRDVHEEGQAGYRRRALMGDQGMVNQGWEYDWAGGKKRNTITSDLSARDRWLPIRPEEYKEREYAKSYGGGVQGYINRLQSEQQNRFGNVMREGGSVSGLDTPGGIQRTPWGGYADQRPDGSVTYYDSYGAHTDASGNRIGGAYDYDGKGTQVVNRVGSPGDTYGHASSNGIAQNPTFTGNAAAISGGWGNNWGGSATPTTPTTTKQAAPATHSRDYRSQYNEDLGNMGGWGNFYGRNYTPIQRARRANPNENPYLQGVR
jgi:hypothetical protein